MLFAQAEVVSLFERVDQGWNLQIAMQTIPARLDKEQSLSHPAQTVIATLPAFHLLADPLDLRTTFLSRRPAVPPGRFRLATERRIGLAAVIPLYCNLANSLLA